VCEQRQRLLIIVGPKRRQLLYWRL